MSKRLNRTIAGVMSLMFMGQVMIFGDGSAQGILHANTIASAAEAIEEAKNAEYLAAEFDAATEGLGEVEYFGSPDANVMLMSETNEADSDGSNIAPIEDPADYLTVTGKVAKGVVDGLEDKSNTPIYIRIFDGNWSEIAYTEVSGNGGSYTVTADYTDVYHVKFECDGYLPFYLKDFGTGEYQVGSGESWDTVTLIPGDTTYNYYNANQWSDDVLDGNDLAYVQSCLYAYRGDAGFNPSMDHDGDGIVSDADWAYFYRLYEELEENEFYDISQSDMYQYDLDNNGVINYYDLQLKQADTSATEAELTDFANVVDSTREYQTYAFIYNHYYTNDGKVDMDDYNEGIDKINEQICLRDRSDNYYEYMDKYPEEGSIEADDVAWFEEAYDGDLYWDHAFKRNITVLENGKFNYSLNLHDTNLDMNGQSIYVGDCMSFTTDMPQFWDGTNGATLDIHGGYLEITNNLVFRTASPDGWSGNAGQLLDMNGGYVEIGGDFNFGQANCYDIVEMTNTNDYLTIYGNWNYITLADMEGKWTAGAIDFLGPVWQVNEASGEKAIYSPGTHSILFYYPYGRQTILWDNCETYINNEDGSLNTERTFNFDYEDGLRFPGDYTEENYWFRPWWRPYDEPDYTLYRKGWEMGDGVHIATGNYTKSFTDLSVTSPGVTSDFVRTYNSMSDEEGSFGIGWDFNIDVSKIVKPASGYYQVVLPDGSNTTFKDDGNGGFECLNAHSTMTKSGDEYTITNAAQSQYHFNADGELDWVKDAEGNKLTISSKENNQRIVTDSTGRTYTITYNGNSEHSRITKIEDTAADRIVTYEYNGDFQLISATSVSGGTEYYEYDGNGRLCKITNCYNEVTDEINYNDNGSVNWLTNASGLKQEYTYDKARKQTGLKEYDGETLIKTFTYDYDEKYAVKTNTVETDGQTYEVDKITYSMVDGENKYDEMTESVDIMGNTTKYDRDDNGNVIKTTYADGTYTLANYNDKNSVIAEVDEMGNATIYAYDSNGTRLLKQATSLNPLSQADISTVTAADFNPITYLEANESSYAITSHEYYADSYVSGIVGLIRATTDPEGNVTEYDYYQDGVGKGLVKSKTLKDGNNVVSTVEYEYNAQLQVSKETASYDLSKNLYSVKEYEYDKFNNVTKVSDFGTGNTAAVTITEYDLLGRLTAEYSPNYSADKSQGTLYTYYADDSIKTLTDAVGSTVAYEYDAYGNVTKKTDPDGTISLTEYDGLQREIAHYFMANEDSAKQIQSTTSYEFVSGYSVDVYTGVDTSSSKSSNMLKTVNTTYVTADKQVVAEILTDYRNNTIYEKTNGETKKTNAYYANGETARQIDALGNAIKYEKTAVEVDGILRKIDRIYTPFNGSEDYTVTENHYDKNGNVILTKQTVQEQDSAAVKYTVAEKQYNAQNLLVQVTVSDGTSNSEKTISQYFYNNAGIQTEMRTGLNSENDSDYLATSYEYDAWGHVIRNTDSTGYSSGIITYDLNGNSITVTDANGNVTTNTYDALNRVIASNTVHPTDDSLNVSQSYTYDNMGKLTKATNNNLTTTYAYDSLGRKIEEIEYDSNGYSTFNGFFYVGVSQQVERQIVGINNLLMYSNTAYIYDDEMRVIEVIESGTTTATYNYDANGNKASQTLANGVVSTYTYNNANLITHILNTSGDMTISEYEYSYYLDGSDSCKTRTENGIIETTSYEYDGLKRLTEESVTTGSTTDTYAYEYDDYGNRIEMTVTGSENYATAYSYDDAQGNYTALLQKESKTSADETPLPGFTTTAEQTVYTYDANGSQLTKKTSEKTETNTYNALNQLVGFTDGETTASYAYNVNGLRYEKTVDGETVHHVWDGSEQIIADVVESQFYEANCYVRGTNLLAAYSYNGGIKSEYTYYTQNAHGDVVNLTDETGAVTKSYTYDAFGVEQDIDDSDANAFRYCGEYFDAETGTVYLRARYYSPTTGRFISRDSYAGDNNDPLSLNLYTYCHNNPVSGTDSTGHFLDTFFDVASLVVDVVTFCIEPTPMGAVDIVSDIAGLLIPGVPSAGIKVVTGVAETAYDAYKAADAVHDISKTVDVTITVAKNGDEVLEIADTANDVKKVSNIVEATSTTKVSKSTISGSSTNTSSSALTNAKTHGNSSLSQKPQHGYEIFRKSDGDVVKTGISGGKLNIDQSSRRANTQVNRWNRAAGSNIYDSRVVITNMPDRRTALDWERNNAQRLHDLGNSMSMHSRPTPWK